MNRGDRPRAARSRRGGADPGAPEVARVVGPSRLVVLCRLLVSCGGQARDRTRGKRRENNRGDRPRALSYVGVSLFKQREAPVLAGVVRPSRVVVVERTTTAASRGGTLQRLGLERVLTTSRASP